MIWSCFEFDAKGHLSTVDCASVVGRWRDGEGPFWIDVESPDQEERGRVLLDLGFSQELVDELMESGHAPRVLPLDEALCFEFPSRITGDPPELKSTLLVCIDRLVVTLRDLPSSVSAEDNLDLLGRITLEGRSTSELVSALLVVSSIALRRRCSERRERAVALSRRMDADPEDVELVEILELKREIVDLDGVTEERAAILEMIGSTKHPSFDLSRAVEEFRVAVGNTAATARRLDRLDRRAGDLQARYDARQMEKTNRRLSRLTIISAVFLPLTLIAGIYGMNFERMPELRHPLGYPLVLGGMVLVALCMVWWFRVRGWMELVLHRTQPSSGDPRARRRTRSERTQKGDLPMRRFAFIVAISLAVMPLLAAITPASAQQPDQYVNAGVFPYSTASGDMLVLLGFDGERKSWSDFVGTCTPGETPPDTAAREFSEETRGAFPDDRIVNRLENLEPVRIGETLLFLVEVPPISAAEIARLAKSRNSEKTEYCWVPLDALLQSIDERGAGQAQVPEMCGASSRKLFDVAAGNLVEGQGLRAELFVAPDEEAVRTSTTWPRCGR